MPADPSRDHVTRHVIYMTQADMHMTWPAIVRKQGRVVLIQIALAATRVTVGLTTAWSAIYRRDRYNVMLE
jgi:hypothetical protein